MNVINDNLVEEFAPRAIDGSTTVALRDIRDEALGLIEDANDILVDGIWFRADIKALQSRIEVLNNILMGLEVISK